jgi:tetrahydromethanopterin S-methyltransferase subunit B
MTDETSRGKGVDSEGRPVIDPTQNVLDLVKAAISRQDDLRVELEKRVETRIRGFEQLSDSRHIATGKELAAIEQRRIEHKGDTKAAVDTALASAKEAVKEQSEGSDKAIDKSERAVGGQIKAVEGTVDDLKARIVKLETTQQTKSEGREDSRSNVGMVVGIGGFILALAMALITVIVAMKAAP